MRQQALRRATAASVARLRLEAGAAEPRRGQPRLPRRRAAPQAVAQPQALATRALRALSPIMRSGGSSDGQTQIRGAVRATWDAADAAGGDEGLR